MAFVNKLLLMGNLTRDPERRDLPSGSSVCDFGLAINRTYKTAAGEEREETTFVDCTAFGRLGDVIAQYARKGRQLFIEGRLHFEAWVDASGNRRHKLSAVVENFQFIGPREAAIEPAAAVAAPPAEDPILNSLKPRPRKRAENLGPQHSRARARERFQPSLSPAMAAPPGKPFEAQAVDAMAERADQLQDADLPF